jgi:hypothetical protein
VNNRTSKTAERRKYNKIFEEKKPKGRTIESGRAIRSTITKD